MPEVVEFSSPTITQSDYENVRLDPLHTVTISSAPGAGNASVNTYFFYTSPALNGVDYPALVKVWDNDVDVIYDSV